MVLFFVITVITVVTTVVVIVVIRLGSLNMNLALNLFGNTSNVLL